MVIFFVSGVSEELMIQEVWTNVGRARLRWMGDESGRVAGIGEEGSDGVWYSCLTGVSHSWSMLSLSGACAAMVGYDVEVFIVVGATL
jgi:hypothetical protein